MPVDQASFRPYQGVRHPGRGAIRAIAGTTIRRVMRRTWLRLMFVVIVLLNLVTTSIMSYFTNQEIAGGQTFGEILEQRGFGPLDPFAISMRGFIAQINLFSLVVAALTAAPLIAEDRRARALPLYFSRPITHVHYVLGKLAAAIFFLGAVLLVPPIAMFLYEIGNSPAEIEFGDRLGVLADGLIPLGALTLALASISLGISSLVERSNIASLALFGLLLFATVFSNATVELITEDPRWYALDPFYSAQAVAHHLLPEIPKLDLPARALPRQALQIPLSVAWSSLAGWTALGVGLLVWRVRRVEVVE
ncbi:MAG: ABC transporter permease subunit [Planctomycetota bacterium]